MKSLKVIVLVLLLCGCSRSDVPKNAFERRILNAALQEAKRQNVAVPSPYTFRIYKDTLIVEMKGSVQVWVVEISQKSDPRHPVIEAELDATNYEVRAFSNKTGVP